MNGPDGLLSSNRLLSRQKSLYLIDRALDLKVTLIVNNLITIKINEITKDNTNYFFLFLRLFLDIYIA